MTKRYIVVNKEKLSLNRCGQLLYFEECGIRVDNQIGQVFDSLGIEEDNDGYKI
jgi:hypothetical protein